MDMPPRVLLVDDQRDITRFLRTALETLGLPLRIDEALSGEEALLALRTQATGAVDVLVADLRLPGMNGLQLLERARRLSPRTRSLVISGAADGEMRREAERLGAAAVLDKPIELKAFLETVTRLLAQTTLPDATVAVAASAESATRPVRRAAEAEPDAALRRELDAVVVVRLDSQGNWRSRLPAHAEAALGDAQRIAAALLPGHWHLVETVDALLVLWREDADVLVAQFAELTGVRLAAVRRRVRREPPRPTTTRVSVARPELARSPVTPPTDPTPLAVNGLAPEPVETLAPLPLAAKTDLNQALSDEDLKNFEQALANLKPQDVDAFWE